MQATEVPTATQKGPAGEVTLLGSIGFDGIAREPTVALTQTRTPIILVARSKSRPDATLIRLRESNPNVTHSLLTSAILRHAVVD
jgi:hypothetical protein